MFRAIDTHAHLNFPQFDGDREALISKMNDAQIGAINVATNAESVEMIVASADKHSNLYATVGLHPTDIDRNTLQTLEETLNHWSQLVERSDRIVAVGEIGLDYFYDKSSESANRQKAALRSMLTFALDKQLPIIFHCRDAYGDLVTILKDYPKVRGVIHCFSGTLTQAKAFVELGLRISFTGMITYPKNDQLREIARYFGYKELLLETDCPFLPLQNFRKERNSPMAVLDLAKFYSELFCVSEDEILEVTTNNAYDIFKL